MAEPVVEHLTASDGYPLAWRRFTPDGQPRGHVVMLHGIQSHGGWYVGSCESLQQAGYAVAFLDRRGSGLNDRDRGDASSFRRLLDDVVELAAKVRGEAAGRKVFLAAISWGGKLAVGVTYRHPAAVDGIALLAPGIFPVIAPTFRERLRIAGAWLVNRRKRFPIPLNDPALFTDNPERQAYIAADPLALREATARFLAGSLFLDIYLRRAGRRVAVPTLLMLAGADRIMDNDTTRRWIESFPSTDIEVFEYPGAGHTLEFEPSPPHVADLIRWLDRHI